MTRPVPARTQEPLPRPRWRQTGSGPHRQPLPGPSYCRENLKLVEKTWKPTKAQQNAFGYMSKCFYDHLYKVLREGAPLQITPQQVRVQMQVMEECHRQNRLSRLPAKGWPKGT